MEKPTFEEIATCSAIAGAIGGMATAMFFLVPLLLQGGPESIIGLLMAAIIGMLAGLLIASPVGVLFAWPMVRFVGFGRRHAAAAGAITAAALYLVALGEDGIEPLALIAFPAAGVISALVAYRVTFGPARWRSVDQSID